MRPYEGKPPHHAALALPRYKLLRPVAGRVRVPVTKQASKQGSRAWCTSWSRPASVQEVPVRSPHLQVLHHVLCTDSLRSARGGSQCWSGAGGQLPAGLPGTSFSNLDPGSCPGVPAHAVPPPSPVSLPLLSAPNLELGFFFLQLCSSVHPAGTSLLT